MTILLLLSLLLPPGLRPWPALDAETAALVRLARDGNRAGIAAVRSLTCRIDESWKDRVPSEPDEVVPDLHAWDFWMDGDTVRVRDRVKPAWAPRTDTIWRGDREMRLWDPGKPDSYVTLNRKRELSPGDARWACLFACWNRSIPYQQDLTLGDLLAGPHEVWAARRVTEEGIDSIYLDLAFPADRLRLWLDPAHNYLVWKAVEKGNWTHEHRVIEFRTAADGAAMPVRIEQRITVPDFPPVTKVTALSEVHLNEPVPAEAFRLPGLAGLRCSDQIRGEQYRLDADGEYAGPLVSEKKVPDDESDVEKDRLDPSWWAVLIVGGFVAVVVLAAIVVYHRRRLRQ